MLHAQRHSPLSLSDTFSVSFFLCQKKGVKETRRPHLSLGRFDGIHILPRISTTHCGSEAIVLWLEK